MAAPETSRRKRQHRRRGDDGEDLGPDDTIDALDDESLSEGSVVSDDNDVTGNSDTSNVEESSPASTHARKDTRNGLKEDSNAHKTTAAAATANKSASETAVETDDPDIAHVTDKLEKAAISQASTTPDLDQARQEAPAVVSSAQESQPDEPAFERRRREHDEYRKKRDADPAFVPNRGAFFMHDHRHAGPAANGFRPFGRNGAFRGRGRGGFGGPFGAMGPMNLPHDPTTSTWAHDMHETLEPNYPAPSRGPPPAHPSRGPSLANNVIPTGPSSATPINRELSSQKVVGIVQIRVMLAGMDKPILVPGITIRQYTNLPDHRPPLRRDKPVRISIPDHQPRYIFPAMDRSFIFIPRALRPSQQRSRGGSRAGFGSIGGFSRRTSIYGGSHYGGSYYGSTYAPSVAMSRRSSIAPDTARDMLISPTSSAFNHQQMQGQAARPVVRLPPAYAQNPTVQMPVAMPVAPVMPLAMPRTDAVAAPQIPLAEVPAPQTHPLPQKPLFSPSQPTDLPMHQPKPQKTLSVKDIESPIPLESAPQQPQQAFHQQMPVQFAAYAADVHARQASYTSQSGLGTPLQQIPESAIHAAPFQPIPYQQARPGIYDQPYPVYPPQQGFYYPPPAYNAPMMASSPAFVPSTQQAPSQQQPYPQQQPQANGQGHTPTASQQQNLVAQELNGMVYYYDASQVAQTMPAYAPPYTAAPAYGPMDAGAAAGGMAGTDTAYYYPPQPATGVVYFPQ